MKERLYQGRLEADDKKLVKWVAQDGINGLANATQAMETLLDLSIEDAEPQTLRQIERVCNLAELTGTLKARLQAKLARHGHHFTLNSSTSVRANMRDPESLTGGEAKTIVEKIVATLYPDGTANGDFLDDILDQLIEVLREHKLVPEGA